MTKYVRSLMIVAAVVMFAANLSHANVRVLLTAKIPDAFMVAGKPLPAGNYDFIESSPDDGTLIVRDASTGKALVVPYNSRLGVRPGAEAVVIFDKQGDKEYLSELHPGDVDGYYFTAATGRHTHVVVKAAK